MKDNQGRLRCLYEIAQKRMEWHPDIADESRNLIKGCPRFDSKDKAVLEYEKMKRERPKGRLEKIRHISGQISHGFFAGIILCVNKVAFVGDS